MTSVSPFSDQTQSDGRSEASEQEDASIVNEQFQPEQNSVSSPLPQQPGQLAPSKGGLHLHGHAPAGDQVRVFISQSALKQVDDHAHSNLDVEVGGVLMGHLREGETHLSIDVLAALPAITDDHGPVHFTFTADAWARIHEDRTDMFPDLQIVGWFHTHPDLGVFYSADDVVVHSAAFVMPWQVGLVLDPIGLEGCLFGWRAVPNDMTKTELIPINGYYEKLDELPISKATWQFVRSSIWGDSYYPEAAGAAYNPDLYLPDNHWPSLPQISPWWGVFLGGLSLLISLYLLFQWLGQAGVGK
ncbi:MAG: Mov34/MPN/PAD-1 family protein [Candidatus Promineifilaceae bacterium]